jgi:hypothetical protein
LLLMYDTQSGIIIGAKHVRVASITTWYCRHHFLLMYDT